MKYLKMIGLAAVAAAALMAIAGASTASATVLCHSTSTPCTEKWGVGTEFKFSLALGSTGNWMTTNQETITTCSKGEIKGNISAVGSGTETVKVSVPASGFAWPECTSTSETLAGGELEIHTVAGTDNGTVTATGFNFTTTIVGVSCSFYFPESTYLGNLVSSSTGNAKIEIGTVLTKKEGGFLCPASLTWLEQYFAQTGPSGTPLYVEPS